MTSITNISYTAENDGVRLLDLHIPDKDSFPVFIYLHGGGLEFGDKNELFIPHLVKNGIAVASVNYRMYPKAKFPEYIIDSAMAVAWVKNNIGSYGECDRIYVGGSSAGGYLTQMLCFDNSYLASVGVDADSISGYYMDAGQPTSHFNVLREKGIDSRRIVVDETAPLYFINAERHYPPIRLIVSDNDIPCRLEQNKMLYATLQHMGQDMQRITLQIIPNSNHCEYVAKLDADGNSVFADMIKDFIDQ